MKASKSCLAAVLLVLSLGFWSGCSPLQKAVYVNAVTEHNTMCRDTCGFLVDEFEKRIEAGVLTDDQVDKMEVIIARLKQIQKTAKSIKDYVYTNYMDEEILAELLRMRASGSVSP